MYVRPRLSLGLSPARSPEGLGRLGVICSHFQGGLGSTEPGTMDQRWAVASRNKGQCTRKKKE